MTLGHQICWSSDSFVTSLLRRGENQNSKIMNNLNIYIHMKLLRFLQVWYEEMARPGGRNTYAGTVSFDTKNVFSTCTGLLTSCVRGKLFLTSLLTFEHLPRQIMQIYEMVWVDSEDTEHQHFRISEQVIAKIGGGLSVPCTSTSRQWSLVLGDDIISVEI